MIRLCVGPDIECRRRKSSEKFVKTGGQFIQSIPAAGAAFAVAGRVILDESPGIAQDASPLEGHFQPQGKVPSQQTREVLQQAQDTLPFADKRDFTE